MTTSIDTNPTTTSTFIDVEVMDTTKGGLQLSKHNSGMLSIFKNIINKRAYTSSTILLLSASRKIGAKSHNNRKPTNPITRKEMSRTIRFRFRIIRTARNIHQPTA